MIKSNGAKFLTVCPLPLKSKLFNKVLFELLIPIGFFYAGKP